MSKPINPIALAPELTLRYLAEVAERLRDVQTGNISFDGDFNLKAISIDADYTAGNESVIVCDTSGGDVSITLPSASDAKDRIYTFKKTTSPNQVVITPQSGETVDASTTGVISAHWGKMTIISDGSNWLEI